MKRLLYFLPVCLLCLFSFKPLDNGQTASKQFIILTGCFEDANVYVEVDYSTGTSSITDVRVYEKYYHYEYTTTDWVYNNASYSGGHIYVTNFTVFYSYGGGSGYAYPPTSMLDNDCQ